MEKNFYEEFEDMDANIDKKQALVEESKKVNEMEDFNEAFHFVNELKKQWKKIPYGESLAEEKLRDEFEANIEKVFAKQKEFTQKIVDAKEELIKEAEKTSLSEDFKKATEKMTSLMDSWKQAGNAGREFDDDLWNAFNEARQNFYTKRNAYYDQLHQEHAQKYAQKQELVQKAKEIANTQQYTRQNTADMKELGVQWKEIGFCGKGKEDEIWKEFRSVMDEYFDGLKKANENRQVQWRNRMEENVKRKEEQIANQKRQIARLQEDMLGLVSEATVQDLQEQVEDREAFISQLQNEIEDIQKKLAE